MSNYIKVLPAVSTPIGATLMKTGQTTSYRTGDDGDLEVGRATSFLVLAENNPFGNTNRFTDELGGQTYTNNIVIDWSTYNGTNVLGYKRTLEALKIWNNAITDALSISIGIFTTGWRVTNVRELFNIFNYQDSLNRVLDYPPFNISANTTLWTSNTYRGTGSALRSNTLSSELAPYDKTSVNSQGIVCRTFTVTGTTLT
jgi:hypothetical protein